METSHAFSEGRTERGWGKHTDNIQPPCSPETPSHSGKGKEKENNNRKDDNNTNHK